MKRFFTFSLIFICFYSFAQIINFPDANFKARLLSASGENEIAKNFENEWVAIDLNEDQEIDIDEAALIKELRVGERMTNYYGWHISTNYEPSILSIEGVEMFANLEILSVVDELLTQVDLGNLSLRLLNLSYNQLSSINLENQPYINNLYLSHNSLNTLDVTNLIYLDEILCDNNNLTYLDLSHQRISIFHVQNNNLQWLNIKNGHQEILYPPLSEDDYYFSELGGNPNLQYICCDEGYELMEMPLIFDFNYGIPQNISINSYCSFVPGGDFNEIQGSVEFDLMGDGCDATTPNMPWPYTFFGIENGNGELGNFYGHEDGTFYIPVSEGQHSITPILENPEYFTVSPTSFIANFPTDESPFTQDICISANGEHPDVEIEIIPLNAARPGFEANYKMVYRNTGNTTIDFGQIKLTNDFDLMEEVSFNPNWNSFTDVDQAWNFNFEDLLPFESREILFTFELNTPTETENPLNDGDILNFNAQIFAEYDTTNPMDEFTLNQTVVNSYDPNDKTCLQGDSVSPEMVGEYVHYMIRFENTGSAEAINIVVKDVINTEMFDIATLKPLDASHDFVTRIKNGNEIEFIFENINLPFDDANNDGYVTFKIKTLDTLEIGDTFENNAEIYFDFNFPIITNTAVTEVEVLSTQEIGMLNEKVQVYPNPVSSVLNIKTESAIKSVQIFNTNGKLVMQTSLIGNQNAIEINVEKLPKAVYLVQIATENGVVSEKILKK